MTGYRQLTVAEMLAALAARLPARSTCGEAVSQCAEGQS